MCLTNLKAWHLLGLMTTGFQWFKEVDLYVLGHINIPIFKKMRLNGLFLTCSPKELFVSVIVLILYPSYLLKNKVDPGGCVLTIEP